MGVISSTSPSIMDLADGHWKQVLTDLGVDPAFLRNIHGPCPFCGGKDRFRFDDKGGNGTYLCNRCGAGNGMEFVKRWLQLEFGPAADKVRAVLNAESFTQQAVSAKHRTSSKTDVSSSIERANWLFSKGSQIRSHDSAGKYLSSRGLDIPPTADYLRFMPDCFYSSGERHPAIVAAVRNPQGTLVSTHKTFLPFGKNALVHPVRRMMKGTSTDGAAVPLGPYNRVIGIAEGIETSLAASILWGIPTFATLSAHGMANFVAPSGVEVVMIYADNDSSGCGQRAAETLAERLNYGGYKTHIEVPEYPDTDWNDVLMDSASSAVKNDG